MGNSFFRGLEPIEPLCALGMLYLVFLYVLRIYIIPAIDAYRKRSPLKKYAHKAIFNAQRLLFYGFLTVGFLLALLVLYGEDLINETERMIDSVGLMPLTAIIVGVTLVIIVGRRIWATIRS